MSIEEGGGNGHIEPAEIHKLAEARERILGQLSQVIVGQQAVLEELLITLFSRGHCLLEGVPGLGQDAHD
jgi:MoxR-like ATPase